MFENLVNGICDAGSVVVDGACVFGDGLLEGVENVYDAVQSNIFTKTYVQAAAPALAMRTVSEAAMLGRYLLFGVGVANPAAMSGLILLTLIHADIGYNAFGLHGNCLLYTSPSPRDS